MRQRWSVFWLFSFLAAFLSAAVSIPAVEIPVPGGAPQTNSPQTAWAELLKRNPYPYLIPIPEPKPSELDGTYTKIVASTVARVHCRRCPDYAPEGGLWRMRLDKGVYWIFHMESGWKSIGSFVVAGDRLLLVNDPTCIDGFGLYRWRREKGQLFLEALDDPCAIKLRAMNPTQQPWMSCRPPNFEAAVTDHWLTPEGCE